MPETVVFSIMRHAATVWNLEKRIQGQDDSPLSPQGAASAARWAETLSRGAFDRALCSDLGRVRQTFDIINQNIDLPVTFDRRLREQHFGRWSGRLWSEIPERDLSVQVARGWDFRPPGGESRAEVLGRSREALLEAAGRWPGDRVLVVCHEGVVKSLLYFLFRRDYLPHEPRLVKPGKLHRIIAANGGLEAGEINVSLEDHDAMAGTGQKSDNNT